MQKKASLIVVFTTVFIDLMGFGILIPILPAFASRNLGITDTEIGIIVAAYSFMQFIFNPILGKISDRIGRRPIILSTLLITAISYLIFSIADSFFLLLLSRMFAGLGGSNISVAQAYIADITSKQDRSKGMGLIGAAFGLGFLFGPLIGGILAKYSYAVCGYGAAGFSLLAFIFAVTSLPESLKEKSSFDAKIKIKLIDIGFTQRVLKSKALGLYVIIFFIVIFSMANIYGT
ncbi:MAG: MFS transporter, partial [Melioribacteraceae bacterium]|nr:MFS transporter [Melioribacteraceae bacterium]